MRRVGRRRAVVVCVLLGLLAVELPTGRAGTRKEEALLAEANRRWSGARCRSLKAVEVKKGADKKGWVKSRVMYWDRTSANHRLRFYFSDGDAIHREFVNGYIPVGTEFTAAGWRVAKRGGELFLELEQVDTGAQVKVYFSDDWSGRVGAKRVPDFERWARLNLFELSAADEVLTDVAPRAPAPSRRAAPAPAPAVSGRASVGLRVLGVAVEPLRIAPGGEIDLVVTYSVEGPGAARDVEILERRVLVTEGRQLTSLESTVRRRSGTFESRQPLRVPADQAEGIYELRVTVEGQGVAAEGSAIFQVVAGN